MHDITLTSEQALDAATLFVDRMKNGFATDKDGNVPLLKAAQVLRTAFETIVEGDPFPYRPGAGLQPRKAKAKRS